MNLIIIATRFPFPLEKGDKLRLYYQIKTLSKHHKITLITLSEIPVSATHIQHLEQFCHKVYIFPLRKWQIAIHLLCGFSIGMPLQVSYFYSPYLKYCIQNIIKKIKPDHIYCQLVRMSPYVMNAPITKTIDFQDAFSLGLQRRADRANIWSKWLFLLEAKRLRKWEKLATERFENCTIISEQDKNALSVPLENKLTVVPNGVDVSYFKIKPGVEKKYELVFVGNMGYHPNIEAVKFLVKNVMPLLQKRIQPVKLLIAGARPNLEVKQLASEQVTISGWMEDIREAYHAAKLFIAPIFFGSGQQNKILEAMACGLPCITTPQVNNAIGAGVNETIFLSETAEEFAEQVVRLLTNDTLREQTGKQAQLFVEQHFSWESATAILETLFEQ